MNLFQPNYEELSRVIHSGVNIFFDDLVQKASNQNYDILDTKGAAMFTKISIKTIYKRVSQQSIPFVRQGKKILFFRQDLIEWLRKQRVKTVDELELEVECGLLQLNQKSKSQQKIAIQS